MENRAHRRLDIKAAVSVTADGMRPIHGWIKNISISGLHIRTDERLPRGTRCSVTLVVREGDERRRFTLHGIVRRHDPEGMGIQFGNIGDDAKREMARLLLESQALF